MNFIRIFLLFLCTCFLAVMISSCLHSTKLDKAVISKKKSVDSTASVKIEKIYRALEDDIYRLGSDENSDNINSTTPLNKLLKGHRKVVLYFSLLHCGTCISQQLEGVNKALDTIGRNNFLIICSYYDGRDLKVLLDTYDVKVPTYNFISRLDNLMLTKFNTPIYFFIDSNSVISNLFVPKTGEVASINNYLLKSAIFVKK